MHGDYERYDESGRLVEKGIYSRNKQHSVWTIYNKKGEPEEVTTYKYGEVVKKESM
jgi:antitoxin component YwqK of YwqJK toxin-antitoxin module